MLNLKWKISIHSVSVAVAGTVNAYLYIVDLAAFPMTTLILSLLHLLVLLPLMIWGRYHLESHTAGELIGGSSSSVILTIAEIMIIQHLW